MLDTELVGKCLVPGTELSGTEEGGYTLGEAAVLVVAEDEQDCSL